MASFSKNGRHPDYFLLAVLFLLVVGGLLILASASSDIGKTTWNDTYYYLKHQILFGLSLGLLGFLVTYFFRYENYKRFAFFLLLGNLILLLLVFTPLGVSSGGASRWLTIGPVTLQPAELLKLTFILYLAAWLSNQKANRTGQFYEGFLPFLFISGITAGLLVIQPATSTVAILMISALAVYFMSGAKWRYIVITMAIGAATLALLVTITPYRLKRVMSFFNPTADSQGANYHQRQAAIAIGSGRIFGVGYGQSEAKKDNNLPAVIDDSIFAVAAQELGFVGASTIVVLFGALVARLFWLAYHLRDRFGRLILIGFATIIAIQSLVNMGAISGIVPLTGVPLPFMSYGGTALAVFLTMMGIAVHISKSASPR